jgi:signal peptide peptidase SppA
MHVIETVANYGIFFACFTAFLMFISCMICFCSCFKKDKNDENVFLKSRFDIVLYKNIFSADRLSFVSTVRQFNGSDNKSFGINRNALLDMDKNINKKTNKNTNNQNVSDTDAGGKKSKGCCSRRTKQNESVKASKQTEETKTKITNIIADNLADNTIVNPADVSKDDRKINDVREDTKDKSIITNSSTRGNFQSTGDTPYGSKTGPESLNSLKEKLLNEESISDNKVTIHIDPLQTKMKDDEKVESKDDEKTESKDDENLESKSKDDGKIKSESKDDSKILTRTPSCYVNEPDPKKRKIYLHYSFDNMNNSDDSSASSVLSNITDVGKNVFKDLEAFVQIVLGTMDEKNVVILIHISSPGGIAYQFESAYSNLMRLREKGFTLVALIGDICASGGYMLASACNEIYCSAYAQIGSVGVVTSFYNYHELFRKVGVIEKTITTGPYKRPHMGGEPQDEESISRVKELVNDTLSVFADMVKKSRNLTDDEMKDILSAKVWYGKQALKKKLVDGIMSPSDYLDELARGKNEIYMICRQCKPKKSSLESLMSLSANLLSLIKMGINASKNNQETQALCRDFMSVNV